MPFLPPVISHLPSSSVQHSDLCINTVSTRAQYSFILVLSDMLFAPHILSSFPKVAHANPILLLKSSVHLPSSVSVPPRFMNFVTCSNTSPPSFICISSCCFPVVSLFIFCIYSQLHSSAPSVYSVC